MKDYVEFTYGSTNEVDWTLQGYAGGAAPIDKLAELVLSSRVNPIEKVTLWFVDGKEIVAYVRKIVCEDRTYNSRWYVDA